MDRVSGIYRILRDIRGSQPTLNEEKRDPSNIKKFKEIQKKFEDYCWDNFYSFSKKANSDDWDDWKELYKRDLPRVEREGEGLRFYLNDKLVHRDSLYNDVEVIEDNLTGSDLLKREIMHIVSWVNDGED